MPFRLMQRGKSDPIHTDKDFDYVMGLMTHIAKKAGGGAKWYKPENGYLIGLRTVIGNDNQYYFIYEDKEDGTNGSPTG